MNGCSRRTTWWWQWELSVPRVPPFAGELDPRIVQMHSFEYRNPSQLKEGNVLVVGAANSGAEIALDISKSGHPTWLSGRHPGHVPINIHGLVARLFFLHLVRFIEHHVLTVTKAPSQDANEALPMAHRSSESSPKTSPPPASTIPSWASAMTPRCSRSARPPVAMCSGPPCLSWLLVDRSPRSLARTRCRCTTAGSSIGARAVFRRSPHIYAMSSALLLCGA